MPEGPEIRIEADRIARVLVGRALAASEFHLPALEASGRRLVGCRVEAVAPRGKAMLVRFDNGLTLYSHNQLYGRWYVKRRGQLPKTGRSLRVGLHTDTHSALLYSASEIALLDEAGIASHPFISRLGPDILDPALTEADVESRLGDTRFARRSLAALYLDQGFLAGNGNYLRSETLFFAGLHPARRPVDLSEAARARLAKETLAVARRSYRTRGITTRPSVAAALKAEGYPRRAYRFSVFDREGRFCFECGTQVARIEMGGRRLYLCPTCQPRP